MSFGIDYGTSNSVLAHFDGKQAYAVPIDMLNLDEWSYPNFELLFPSVVGYSSTRPDRLFGWEAKLRSEESVEAVKRLLRGDERVTLADEGFDASTVVAGFFDALRRRAAGKEHKRRSRGRHCARQHGMRGQISHTGGSQGQWYPGSGPTE